MKAEGYIIFKSNWREGGIHSVVLSRCVANLNNTTLKWNEVAVGVEFEIPESAFDKALMYFTAEIDEDSIRVPEIEMAIVSPEEDK